MLSKKKNKMQFHHVFKFRTQEMGDWFQDFLIFLNKPKKFWKTRNNRTKIKKEKYNNKNSQFYKSKEKLLLVIKFPKNTYLTHLLLQNIGLRFADKNRSNDRWKNYRCSRMHSGVVHCNKITMKVRNVYEKSATTVHLVTCNSSQSLLVP